MRSLVSHVCTGILVAFAVAACAVGGDVNIDLGTTDSGTATGKDSGTPGADGATTLPDSGSTPDTSTQADTSTPPDANPLDSATSPDTGTVGPGAACNITAANLFQYAQEAADQLNGTPRPCTQCTVSECCYPNPPICVGTL